MLMEDDFNKGSSNCLNQEFPVFLNRKACFYYQLKKIALFKFKIETYVYSKRNL